MLLQNHHLPLAAEHLDEAVERIRSYGPAGVNYELDALADHLPEIRTWLTGLPEDPDWATYFYNSYVEFGLVLAEALRLALTETDTEGLARTAAGWHVAQRHPTIWFGDAHLDGDLTLDGPLIVLGDLTVDGLLSDGDVDRSFLAVTGDVRARAIHTGAFNLVVGSITADVIVCFNSDGGLGAGKDIVADLFVQDQHSYDLGGELRVRVAVLDWFADGTAVEHELSSDEQLATWLPPDYVTIDDGDVEVDTWRLLTEAAAGRSPLLAQPAATPASQPDRVPPSGGTGSG